MKIIDALSVHQVLADLKKACANLVLDFVYARNHKNAIHVYLGMQRI